jgi:predicted kinase
MEKHLNFSAGAKVAIDRVADILTLGGRRHLIVLVGIPASGKSTLAERLAARGYHSLSLDAIRAELSGDEADQSRLEDVIKTFHKRLERRMEERKPLVVDATSTKFEDRRDLTRFAYRYRYNVTLVMLDTPVAVAIERNGKRERVVPDEAIVRMHHELKGKGRPRAFEGDLVVFRPGEDAEHYVVHRVREVRTR